MSPTRLLILGTVRIFQPVHGYFVRRELLSWHAEEWAHLNPGSVYNALRALTREGFLAEVGTEAEGRRPARTTYGLTADGEAEFLVLLRKALWTVAPHDPSNLLAGWSFAWALKRQEVIAALEQRSQQIEAAARATEFAIEDLARSPEKPSHVAEHLRLAQARLGGEAEWASDLAERLRAGEHWFAGEGEPPWVAREAPGRHSGRPLQRPA